MSDTHSTANRPPPRRAWTVTRSAAGPASRVRLPDRDPDGDTLTFELVSQPTHGRVTHEGGNAFIFDPRDDFDELAEGETRVVSFTYRVSDEHGGSAIGSVTYTVTGVNDPPPRGAWRGAQSADDGPRRYRLPVTDPEGDALTFELVSQPTHGRVTHEAGNAFIFYPDGDFDDLAQGQTREASFTYRVTDEHGASATGTLTITVTGVNAPPVAASSPPVSVSAGGPVTPGRLEAADPNGDDLTYSLLAPPAQGTATVAPDGAWSFDPGDDFDDLAAGESRSVTFTWRVTDEHDASATGTLTITVTGVNDPPVAAVSPPVSVSAADTPVAGQLRAEDIDGDDLTYSLLAPPAEGTAAVAPDGTWSFDPGDDFDDLAEGRTREVSFTYRVTDEHGGSDEGSVTITVEGVHAAPVEFARQIRETAPAGRIVAALEIRHPAIETPVRVVNDTEDLELEGNTYTRLRFEARLADDVEGRAPTAQIVIDNIGRELTQWVERAEGGLGATVRVMLAAVTQGDGAAGAEWESILDVTGVTVDQERVTVNLGYDPLLGRPAVTWRHDPETSPGLF